jgi:hypothetical protein
MCATSFTTNPTRPLADLELNQGLRGDRPTNRLNHGTVCYAVLNSKVTDVSLDSRAFNFTEKPRSFETSGPLLPMVRRNIQEDLNVLERRCENVKICAGMNMPACARNRGHTWPTY